jgi:putative nucleotidyltransferase with HDIG domain
VNPRIPDSSAPPPRTLGQRLREIPVSTQRWLAAALVLAGGLALVPWPRATERQVYQLGMIQPTAVIADFDFPVLKEQEELDREKTERAKTVPAVVERSDSASAAAYARVSKLRDSVKSLRLARGSLRAGRNAPDHMVLPFTQETLIALLVDPNFSALLDQSASLLEDVMRRGFVSPDLAGQLSEYREVRIRDPLGDAVVPTDQLLTPDRVRELARARAVSRGLPPEPLAEITVYCAVPNLVFDPASTGEQQQKAMATVEPATGLVLKGEKMIGAHERITPENLRVLRSYQHWRGERGVRTNLLERVLPVLGRLLICLLGLSIFAAYLKLNRPELLGQPHEFWLLASIEALVLFIGAVFVRILQLPPVLVPVAAVAILVTLLFDERLALAAAALPVLLVAVVADGGTPFLAVVGTGAVATILLTHAVRQRSQFFRHLALLPLIHLVMMGALALAEFTPLAGLPRESIAVVANPFLAAALALFVLPYAELLFGRSSDISLREFQDLNRPLLRRLMMSAPGTYHHSILVGTLAETAALAVGANPVLARVIGYYHDIGKVAKPEYFAENTSIGMKNPHDRLTPSMSRLILESHIREGLALAREERLPREIVQGIREHHGSSVMLSPFRRARRQDPKAKAEDYRYPGPRPSNRASALVLLADQVETAARSLENPTPSRIKGLVTRVVQDNLEAGNLEESGLTLRDLARVRDAFVPMLAVAFRGRLETDRGVEDGGGHETGPHHAPLPRRPR